MKLWKKITLVCGMVLILTVTACTYIQLNETRNALFETTSRRFQEKSRSLCRNFEQMVTYYDEQDNSPAAQKAMLHYCFTRLADSKCVLIVNGETIWSETDLKPEEIAPIEDSFGYASYIDGKMFLEGTKLRPNIHGSPECVIYVMEDITVLDEMIGEMVPYFLRVGLVTMAVGLVLIVLLVWVSTKPLRTLQTAASEIAAGNYDRRVQVRGKDEVGALAVSFNHMAENVEAHVRELTEAAERQRLFTGAVTHEFKTPLTGILLNADSLQNTYMTEEEQQEALEAIQSQGKWLERLVQKLLKLLTLKQEITLEPVSARELLEQVRESTAEVLKQREVKLDIQCGAELYRGDADLLRSALVNLVDNASKASKPGQTVWLTASEHRLEVADQGTGIPAEALKHITEPFYMADRSRSKHQGGVGLGMTLVKEIVSAHGGTLEVESTPGIGTIVRIKFP